MIATTISNKTDNRLIFIEECASSFKMNRQEIYTALLKRIENEG